MSEIRMMLPQTKVRPGGQSEEQKSLSPQEAL